MSQNVAYANNDPQLATLLSFILPYINDTHGDGILNGNFVTAVLNAKGAKEVVDGGLEFWETVSVNPNSNFKWQGDCSPFLGVILNCVTRITVKIQRWTRPCRQLVMSAAERLTRASLREGYTVRSTAIIA